MKTKYLILGAGVAGLSAAEAIRQEDPSGRIVMITQENWHPYARPMLTKAPLRALDVRRMLLRQPSWYEQHGIEVHLSCPVMEIDGERHWVKTSDGTIEYGKCIYALGASNFIPPIEGADSPGVYSIRTIEDLQKVKRHAATAERAVIVGGGVIGLEMAVELSHYGVEVTVLEAMPYLMARVLDAETARDLQRRMNFAIETGVQIRRIGREPFAVYLEDGRRFPCDFVILSCGVRANIQAALRSRIACERSVIVNERMETNVKDIYACGDCAQYKGRNAALWAQAVEQGKTAGINAAGGFRKVQPFDDALVLNTREISLFVCGDLGKREDLVYMSEETESDFKDRYWVNRQYGCQKQRRFFANGRLVGVSLLGNLSDMQQLKAQIGGAG